MFLEERRQGGAVVGVELLEARGLLLLAEHRTELARSAQTHAEHLAQVPQREAADHDLRAALLEQAKLQREANDDVADHIAQLTTIVADLGQTVGMLAVAAAQEARQSRLPTRPTFAAPPPVEPRAAATSASTQWIEAAVLDAPPGALPTAAAPGFTMSTAANSESPASHSAAHTPPSSPSFGSASTAATVAATTAPPLAEARAEKAPLQHPIRLARAEEAAAQVRVRQFADEDRDDDLETGIDNDEPPCRPSLPVITKIDPPTLRERDHG